MEKSLKDQAKEIMVSVENDVDAIDEQDSTVSEAVGTQANTILEKLFNVINDVDIATAEEQVQAMRERYPTATNEELVQYLIQQKCQQTGMIGAVTSGAGLIPGIGSAAAMTLGVAADIGATFKLQAELVLEVASVYNYPLTAEEKQHLVMLITGLSAGTAALVERAGQEVSIKVTEKLAEKTILNALPIIGVIASAGTNVVSTYIIGRRADAYFRLGSDAMISWSDSLRAMTGLDERRIISWLAETGRFASSALTTGVGYVGGTLTSGATTVSETSKTAVTSGINLASEAGKSAGTAIYSGATNVSNTLYAGAEYLGGTLTVGASVIASVPQGGLNRVRSLIWSSEDNKIVEGEVLSRIDITLNEAIYPLTFAPVFRDYIWGGRHLETVLGRQIPDGIVAESWEISGHASSPTFVDSGPLAGVSLPGLLSTLGLDLVGQRSLEMLKREKFPLLIKLLDANQPLSVQVHPNDEYAAKHENGELGKTEMWYVLHAKPSAYLIYGLAKETTPEAFGRAAKTGELDEYLHKLPVKTGDAVFIPAGSLHAIMDGIIIAEIQQNSDTTYRVYDWNRVGADGQSRPLHIDKALEVTNFRQLQPTSYPIELIETFAGYKRERITACPYFNVERLTLDTGSTFRGRCDGSTFEIWGVISGAGTISWAGKPLELSAVRFTLLPAILGDFEVQATQPSEWLRVYVP